MKQSNGMAIASFAGGTLVVLAACSSTKSGEDLSRGAQAQSLGTPDQPTSCGPYFGDAALNPVSSNPDHLVPPPAQFSGRITEDAPRQNGWFGVPFTPFSPPFDAHSCDAPNPTPSVVDQGRDIHYNAVFLKNWTNADACISVSGIDIPGINRGGGPMIAAYVGPFDPNDILKNNVAAQLNQGVQHFAFKVPANTAFEVVAMAEGGTDDNGTVIRPVSVTWGLDIANCGEPQSDGGTSSGGTDGGSGTSGDSGGGGAGDGGGNAKSW